MTELSLSLTQDEMDSINLRLYDKFKDNFGDYLLDRRVVDTDDNSVLIKEVREINISDLTEPFYGCIEPLLDTMLGGIVLKVKGHLQNYNADGFEFRTKKCSNPHVTSSEECDIGVGFAGGFDIADGKYLVAIYMYLI